MLWFCFRINRIIIYMFNNSSFYKAIRFRNIVFFFFLVEYYFGNYMVRARV
jgi:hypothetical protein